MARHGLAILFVVVALFVIVNFFSQYTPVYRSTNNCKYKELALSSYILQNEINRSKNVALPETNNESLQNKCEVIHVGLVCSGYRSNLYVHVLAKSIFFYRNNPLHFHIVVNKVSEKVLKTLFDTWAVPQVNVTFYDINETVDDVRWVPNSHYSGIYGLMKLQFPKIIPKDVTNRIIILDTDLIFTSDIYELWRFFDSFNYQQILGIVENQSDFYLGKNVKVKLWPAWGRGFNTGVMLYNLERLRRFQWEKVWTSVTKQAALIYGSTRLGDQDIMNTVIKQYTHIVYKIPCQWNTQLSDHTLSHECYNNNAVKVVHWNSPKKLNVVNPNGAYFRSIYTTFLELNGNLLKRQLYDCSGSHKNFTEPQPDVCEEFHKAQTNKWRSLPFFREFKYTATKDDITFMVQTSFERLQMIEDLCKYWKGPIAVVLYLTDPEFQEVQKFIESSEVLQDRLNIAYHVVFRDGEYHPINILRNVGLAHITTPYVFLADIDFLPVRGLYTILKFHLGVIKDMSKKALVVPAFETQKYRSRLPKNKKELIEMLDKKFIYTFRYDVWASGHAPTNYKKWRTAKEPYTVRWEPDFEPYIVVSKDVIPYDNRFMGFGWNKVSHIMELEAQGYEFLVLPEAFIIHKPHAPSYDILKFRSSPTYRMCLQNLKEEFIEYLVRRYGRNFRNRNSTIPLIGR